MEMSRERMKLVKDVPGRESRRGWLVVDLRGLDLENVNELRFNLDAVAETETQQEQASRLFDSLSSRLGGEDDAGDG